MAADLPKPKSRLTATIRLGLTRFGSSTEEKRKTVAKAGNNRNSAKGFPASRGNEGKSFGLHGAELQGEDHWVDKEDEA